MEISGKINFKHMKTPEWASPDDIYFLVLLEREEIGYIGLQRLDFKVGACNNICYKTDIKARGLGLTKRYFEQFIKEDCPFNLDCYKAVVLLKNVSSIKILKNAGFEEVERDGKKAYFQLRRFDY